jgi:hypothetical protein
MRTIELSDDAYEAIAAVAREHDLESAALYLEQLPFVLDHKERKRSREASSLAVASLRDISSPHDDLPQKIGKILGVLYEVASDRFSRKLDGFRKENGQRLFISRDPEKIRGGWISSRPFPIGQSGWWFNGALSEHDAPEFLERICRELDLSVDVKREILRILSEKITAGSLAAMYLKKRPNKSPEPTPRLGVIRSLVRRAKSRGNSRGVAHL